MYARPSAPVSIGGVIDDAIKLYIASFSRCWVIALMSAAITAALNLTLLVHTQYSFANPRQALSQLTAAEHTSGFIVGYLATILLACIFYGALFARQNSVAHGDQSFTLARALGTGLRKLPAMLGGIILFVVLFSITFGVGGAVLFVLLRGPIGRVIAIILLIAAAVYVFGRFVLWIPALIVDDLGPLQSIDTSWKLTHGRWWRSAAIITVAGIIIVVFALVFSAVSGALAAVLGGFRRGNLQHGLTIFQLISSAWGVITLPMAPALWLAMYNDFKLRREGGDLTARVGALPST